MEETLTDDGSMLDSNADPTLKWHRFNAFNPFKPEFTIVIFIHYKPRIVLAILDL